MIHFFIPATSTPFITSLDGDEGVRRILCYSSSADSSNILYNGNIIGTFTSHNNFSIEFESYYGYPKISDFSIEVAPNVNVSVLVDILQYGNTKNDYINTRSTT